MGTKGFSYIIWDCNKNGKWVNDVLTAILLPSGITAIRIEAQTKKTESECQGNILADFHVMAAAIESIKVVAQVDEIHSASTKKEPYC